MTKYKVIGVILGKDVSVTILMDTHDWHFAKECAVAAIKSGMYYRVQLVELS